MATFKAADAAEPLDFDFAPYSDEKGTVPEPTDDQVAEFFAELPKTLERGLGAERLEGVDMMDPVSMAELMRTITAEDNRKCYDGLLDLYTTVCSKQPSREALEALPFRLRRAWYSAVPEWLRPESWRPATDD